MKSNHPVLIAIAWYTFALAGIPARAAEPPYNPDHLGHDQLARISNICQNVMGLSPGERLSGGNWMGNDRLDSWTSHYRGCILSLSDSLQNALDEEVTRQADADCRAKGLESGSSELALCVIQSVNTHPDPAPSARASAAISAREKLPLASGTFTYASPDEAARREELACAALGLEPSRGAFKSCVKALSDTFYSIDHPIN